MMAIRVLGLTRRCDVLVPLWLDEFGPAERTELRGSLVGTVVVPGGVALEAVSKTLRPLPPIVRHELEGAVVTPYSSTVSVGQLLLVERPPVSEVGRVELREQAVRYVGRRLAIRRRQPTTLRVENGLFMGGNGAFNYFHFVIEILTKLTYLPSEDLDHLTLVLPKQAGNVPQFRDLLRALCPEASMILLDENSACQVDSLTWISQPSGLPINLKPGCIMRPDDTFIDPISARALREKVLNEVAQNPAVPPSPISKVFLGRSTPRRQYNQDEIASVAEAMGFVVVDPGSMDLRSQVELFGGADYIVGPSGAAWTNLLFIKHGARGLYWITEDLRDFAVWSTLGSVFGADIRHFTHGSPASGNSTSPPGYYTLDPQMFSHQLQLLLDQ